MNLKVFNAETSAGTRSTGKPTVRMNSKSGTITLSKELQEMMEVNAGEKLSIAQDQDNKEDWYLFKDPEKGFKVRTKEGQPGCTFQSTSTVKSLFAAVGVEDQSARFLVSKAAQEIKGVNYFPIITRKL